ncbi:MAG: DUF5996 family protein [Anaerolineae bacterium]
MSNYLFPDLTEAWAETRQTLHLYANAIGVIPRAHAEAHPKWWHVSLKTAADGLRTETMALPDGGTFYLRLDLEKHQAVLSVNGRDTQTWDMTAVPTSTELGDAVIQAVAGLGLTGEYARQKFENDEPRQYDTDAAGRFWTAVQAANAVFQKHRDRLADAGEDLGIVQLWPHGFDLSFEWYGAKEMAYEEHGETKVYPSQLNLGFYPGGTPDQQYFYSNPWPFATDDLVRHPLPEGASWHTEGWQGTFFPYAELVGDEQGTSRLQDFAWKVYEIAKPTLMACKRSAG